MGCIKGNLTLFDDMKDLLVLINGPVTPVIEPMMRTMLRKHWPFARRALEHESWGAWTSALKQETGRKGRALFMPLRLALTGQAHGPEMQHLLPLIGYDKAQARLQGKGRMRGNFERANGCIFLTPPCATASKRPASILPWPIKSSWRRRWTPWGSIMLKAVTRAPIRPIPISSISLESLDSAKLTAFGMTKRAGRSAENDPGFMEVVEASSAAVCLVAKSWDYHVDVALGISNEENLPASATASAPFWPAIKKR